MVRAARQDRKQPREKNLADVSNEIGATVVTYPTAAASNRLCGTEVEAFSIRPREK